MDFSSKTQILSYHNLICHGFDGEYNWNNNLKIMKASRKKTYQATCNFKHEEALLAITKEIPKLWENSVDAFLLMCKPLPFSFF